MRTSKSLTTILKIWFACTLFLPPYFQSSIQAQSDVVIEGSIQLKGHDANNPEPGAIRWTGTDFQGWNGTKWISLTTGIAYEREVMDIDGNIYPTIIIGTQEWMVENLKTSKYSDGTSIPQVSNNSEWQSANYGAWCWYDNDNSYEQPYGKLYNWYALNDSRGLCPTGWHEPTDSEWTTLLDFLGGLSIAAGPIKAAGTAHWHSPNTGATNMSGFTGIPGGYRLDGGNFVNIGSTAFWSSSDEPGGQIWARRLEYNSSSVSRLVTNKFIGSSVRCVRN